MSRKKRAIIPIDSPRRKGLEYLMLVIGSLVLATSFNVFLNPNQIASGGVSGLSTILFNLFGWSPAIIQWAVNIPLLLIGMKMLDKQTTMKAQLAQSFCRFA